jgi:hypothetical protein
VVLEGCTSSGRGLLLHGAIARIYPVEVCSSKTSPLFSSGGIYIVQLLATSAQASGTTTSTASEREIDWLVLAKNSADVEDLRGKDCLVTSSDSRLLFCGTTICSRVVVYNITLGTTTTK